MNKGNLSVLIKALKVSIRTKGPLSIIVSIIGFGIAFLPALVAKELQKLTDSMQQLMVTDVKSPEKSIQIFTVLVLLFIVQAVFQFLQDYTQQLDRINTHKYIKKTIIKHKCEVKYKYVENYDKFQERIAFADSYAGFQVASSMQNIILLLQKAITFISVISILYTVNPFIVIVLLLTSIPAVIISYLQKDENYRHQTKWMEEGHLVIHYFFICSGEEAIQEVRHYGLFDYLKARWRSIADEYCGKKNKLTVKHVKYNSTADFLRNIVYIAVLLLTAHEIYKSPLIGLGTFTLVFTLSGKIQEVTAELFVGIAQFFNDIPYIKEFFYLDSLEKEEADFEAVPLENGGITFEHVDFTYPNSDTPVLQDINVKIKDGEKIAIVGENGSGKSTFISLLCGMFEPDRGVIKIGEKKLQEHLSEARNTMSVVFQDFGHYETTIRNNITISNKGRNASDEEILELLRETNSFEVIENQPKGLNEVLGSFSEKGNNLSGGQWQKISITRAAYRENAKIMILDEPTAALDPLAETQLYKDFAKITGDKTTILISHRLGITSVVDRILVFHNGKIVEDGKHAELMHLDGYYAKMYRAQAQWYE
jgi:ATP-binding cassette, subfamily B, bacterial